jgi:hypothetical protein
MTTPISCHSVVRGGSPSERGAGPSFPPPLTPRARGGRPPPCAFPGAPQRLRHPHPGGPPQRARHPHAVAVTALGLAFQAARDARPGAASAPALRLTGAGTRGRTGGVRDRRRRRQPPQSASPGPTAGHRHIVPTVTTHNKPNRFQGHRGDFGSRGAPFGTRRRPRPETAAPNGTR